MIQRNFNEYALREQKAFAQMDTEMEGVLKGKGMIFNAPEPGQFRDKLQEAGYYRQWKKKFGPEAWAKLEQYTGLLGA